MSSIDLDPQPTFGWAMRFGRHMSNVSVRQLSAASGVSAGQISRLSNDHSHRPSIDTVVRLAPTLGIHPACLHVLAGHFDDETARSSLTELVNRTADSIEAEYGTDYLDGLRSKIADADGSSLRDCAVELITMPVHGIDFPRIAALDGANLPDADLLEEIAQLWPRLTPERRWRLVETTRDFGRCSKEDRATATQETP